MRRRIELPIVPAPEKATIDQVSTEVRFSAAVAAFRQLLRGEPHLEGFGYDEAIALAATARGEDILHGDTKVGRARLGRVARRGPLASPDTPVTNEFPQRPVRGRLPL